MKDAARLAAAIEVLEAVAATDRAADRVLDRYLKDRRYIGGGDRGEIARRVWGVLRRRARLDWWIKKAGKALQRDARGRVLADVVLTDGLGVGEVATMFDGSRHAPPALTREEGGALRLGGALPTNTSGGQLSEAHGEGMLQIVEGVRQLQGIYGPDRQVAGAEIGLVSGHGGNTVWESTLVLGAG